MKVLFLAHGFPPVTHSGTFRSEAFAKYLPDFGIEPVVVSANDEAYRVLRYCDNGAQDDGGRTRVYRTPWGLDKRSRPLSSFGRVLQRLPLGWTWACRAVREEVIHRVMLIADEAIREHQPAVILATSPPVESLLAADRIAQKHGLPFVCDLRDPWTYSAWSKYRHRVDFWLERLLERRLLDRAARAIANTPMAKQLLLEHVGVSPSSVAVIPNGYDESEFAQIDNREPLEAGKFTILYTGLLATNHREHGVSDRVKEMLGLDHCPVECDASTRSPRWFLAAVERLFDSEPQLPRTLRVQFLGAFSEDDQTAFREFRYQESLVVRPSVPARDAIEATCRADLLLLLQLEMRIDGRDYCTAVPGKLYNYLRSGRPILAPMQESDSTMLIRKYAAGRVVPPREVGAIAEAILEEYRQWQDGTRRYHQAIAQGFLRYERRELTYALARVLREAAGIGESSCHAEVVQGRTS